MAWCALSDGPTQGSSWGYLKVNSSETLSIFGDKYLHNGSKNDLTAPRTTLECPHEGPSVVQPQVETQLEKIDYASLKRSCAHHFQPLLTTSPITLPDITHVVRGRPSFPAPFSGWTSRCFRPAQRSTPPWPSRPSPSWGDSPAGPSSDLRILVNSLTFVY